MENITNFIDEKSIWDRTKKIVSKTDCLGRIVYTNDVFQQAYGYDRKELIGKSHNVTKHPDMPNVIFKKLRESSQDKNYAIIKEQSRDGKYSWVLAEYTADKDKKQKIIGYTSVETAVPKAVIDFMEPIYKTLLEIENVKGRKSSEQYLDCFLKEEHNKTYENLILDLVKKHTPNNQVKTKKTSLKNFFF